MKKQIETNVTIEGGEGRDKIEEIEETTEKVMVTYNDKSGKLSTIEVPRRIIDWVGDFIESLNVGESIKSVELYESFIRHFKVKSAIAKKHIQLIKASMEKIGFDEIRTRYLIEELENNDDFGLMHYKEFIGTRKTDTALYFKCWMAIRYWKEKEKIDYSQRGTITRVI